MNKPKFAKLPDDIMTLVNQYTGDRIVSKLVNAFDAADQLAISNIRNTGRNHIVTLDDSERAEINTKVQSVKSD